MRAWRNPMVPIIAVIISILLFSGNGMAAWIDMGAPSRAYIRTLAGAGDALLAGSEYGNLFRSEDGGAHWAKSSLSPGYPVLSLFAYHDTVFAARSQYFNPLFDCFSDCVHPRYATDIAESRN